jgi:hypothetical protein
MKQNINQIAVQRHFRMFLMFVLSMASRFLTYIFLLITGICGCVSGDKTSMVKTAMTYQVHRVSEPVVLDNSWNDNCWKNVGPLDLKYFMGEQPLHRPLTQAKLLYDDKAIYVMFRVEDRYVRAVAEHQGPVCADSCVEFFFTPGKDVKKGYFNLEMNCGGTMLFNRQVVPCKNPVVVASDDCMKIAIYHSLPQKVDPEIQNPIVWLVSYRVPFEILEKYAAVEKPCHGVVWRANFYKCADSTSHPHWLTWAPVSRPQPNFHVPECFGVLEFK